MRGGVLILVTLSWLALPAIATADGVKISQRLVDRDGWPMLVGNYSPDGRGTVSWRVCAADCGPVVATGGLYSAGPTSVGTTFEASATVDGTTTTERSPAWGGQVTNTAPPRFDGEPRVGQTLTPQVGTWTGGWGDDYSLIGMRACPTAAAQDCRGMTASSVQSGNPSQVTVDPAYAGWYVGAIEARVGRGTAYPAILYTFPPGRVSSLPAPLPGQTVAVGPLRGPIPGPSTITEPIQTVPPAARLPFTPRVTIRRRAVRRGGALMLAAVRCSGRCVAHATLRHGRKAVTRRIVVTGGQAAVKLRPGTFSRRATAVRVAVRFDNHPATASGSVKLR